MRKLQLNENEVLNELMKSSKGLDAFSLFRRLKIAFSNFSKTMRTLCEEGLIEEESDDFFIITSSGIGYLTKRDFENKNRPWRAVPEDLLITKLSTTDYYVPSTRLLDKTTFNRS